MDGVSTFFAATAVTAATGLLLSRAGMINSHSGHRTLGKFELGLGTLCLKISYLFTQALSANIYGPRRSEFYDPLGFPPQKPEDVRDFKFFSQGNCTAGNETLVLQMPNGTDKVCLASGNIIYQQS